MPKNTADVEFPQGFILRHTLKGHRSVISRLAWSPDGQRLASPSYDKSIRIWDANTGTSILELKGHENRVTGVTWSPDGKQLASSSDDETVRLWDVTSGEQLPPPLIHSDIITSVGWSPDGRSIASGSDDTIVRLWDVKTRTLKKVIEEHADRVLSVAWSPDGKMLASASWDGTVRFWDGETGEARLSPLNHKNKKVSHVAWSPDGKMLASASSDGTISVWDSSTGSRLELLEGHEADVLAVSFSSDSKFLASKSLDTTVRLWHLKTEEEVQLSIPGSWPYSNVTFNPQQPTLAALCENDRHIYIWDLDFDAIFRQHPIVSDFVNLSSDSDPYLYILHLSDIHLGTKEEANQLFAPLETDLKTRFNVKRLQYLVVSGDSSDHAAPDEFKAAEQLLSHIVNAFGPSKDRVILVPGNHDVNWDSSDEAYTFKPNRKFPKGTPSESEAKDRYVRAGDIGWLERNEARYSKRFQNFGEFYERVCGKKYPLKYDEQGILHMFDEDGILVVALNSSWNLDSYNTSRASIHLGALTGPLLKIGKKYDGWLKVAVWHHPVSGRETMDDAFLEQLASRNFQLILHGHIHRPVTQIYEFDSRYGIRIIGAGTFAAPTKQLVPRIPLQYNLMILDPNHSTCAVHISKKEYAEGAWTAYGHHSFSLERWWHH